MSVPSMASKVFVAALAVAGVAPLDLPAADPPPAIAPRAEIDGQGPDWVSLGESDFVNVNGKPDTWTWKDGIVHCTGQPVGIMRTKQKYTNFELVLQWRHLSRGGNSGVFVWMVDESLENLPPGRLPQGIEVQVLDHGYTEIFQQQTGKPADWFTSHGDVFPVGQAKMKPFPPVAPNGERSFPRQQRSLGTPAWNHYYVRGINGEIRLWVNGGEVSGGNHCEPRSGYLGLESEGAPVEFREIRIRELP